MAMKKEMSMNMNLKLTEDIIKVIFSKLPFSNLPNCRIVCKAWNDLVLDYTFFTKFRFRPNNFVVCTGDVFRDHGRGCRCMCNLKLHCFDYDTNCVGTLGFDDNWEYIAISGSCNGLLQILKTTKDIVGGSVDILNPMTKEFIELSRFEYIKHTFGFGFSPKTSQYKLFRITYEREFSSTIEVLRVGIGNEWKPLSSEPFRTRYNSTYLDGVIYWIGNTVANEFVIYALDVETEVFETVAILDVGPYSPMYFVYFQPYNATICLIIKMEAPVLKMQVWIMRDKRSWIREFVYDLLNDNTVRDKFHLVKADKGELFFLDNHALYCFDKTGKKIKIKTLFNPNKTKIKSVFRIESLHFGSLQKILTGN